MFSTSSVAPRAPLVAWMALLCAASPAFAQAGGAKDQRPSLDGTSTFKAYCSPCHGMDGKGHGPVAEVLNPKPIDLTVIAKNNLGMFPRATIEDLLLNGGKWKAHGSKDMPIWGPIFLAVDGDEKLRLARIANLVVYLESIQVK